MDTSGRVTTAPAAEADGCNATSGSAAGHDFDLNAWATDGHKVSGHFFFFWARAREVQLIYSEWMGECDGWVKGCAQRTHRYSIYTVADIDCGTMIMQHFDIGFVHYKLMKLNT